MRSERQAWSWAPRAPRGHLGPLGIRPLGLRTPTSNCAGDHLEVRVQCPPVPPRDSLQRARQAKAAFLKLQRLNFLSPSPPLHPVCHPELHECGTHWRAGVSALPHHIREQVSQTQGGDIQPRCGPAAPTRARCVPTLLGTVRRLG